MKKYAVLTLIALFSTLNLSCSGKETEIDKIGDAQHCLDKYAQEGGDLDTCVAKIEGVETPGAYGIRCAAGYIEEGFTTQTFIDAFEDIENVDASTVETFLNNLTFDNAGTSGAGPLDTNMDFADTVYNYCHQSKGKGATILATFTYLVNGVYKLACDQGVGCAYNNSTNFGGGLLAGRIDNTAPTVSFREGLGEVVVKTHELSCTTGEANETLCDFLSRSINNAAAPTNNEIGREFIEVITTP